MNTYIKGIVRLTYLANRFPSPNSIHTDANKSVIFNYSDTILTEPMEKVLNRGLNFSVLPNKLDLTQVLVDYKRYERSAIWR